MQVQIKNLGPIEEAVLDLEDITVLIGPPNVGKSYTLKAIYSLLSPLDQIVQRRIIRQALQEMFKPITLIDDRELFEILTLLTIFYSARLRKVDELTDIVKQITNADIRIEEDDKNISINFKTTLNIDLNTMEELIREGAHAIIYEVLPVDEKTHVNIKEALPLTILPELLKFLKSLENKPHVFTRATRDPILEFEIRESTGIGLEGNNLSLERNVILNFSKSSSLLVVLQRGIEITSVECMLEKMKKMEQQRISEYLLKHLTSLYPKSYYRRFYLRFHRIGRPFYKQVLDYLVDKIGRALTRIYQDALEIRSVLFIPFGRSPLVYQLEEFTVTEPKYIWEAVLEYYKSNIILYSYLSRLERGRKAFSEGKYDDMIIKVFRPILQGDLWFDAQTRELRYRRWGFEELYKVRKQIDVSMKWASALSSEVAGIFLPILDAPINSCILIEEPESQLHPSAQILMALGFVALSKLYRNKIVVSTHSDIFAYTLACAKVLKLDKEKVLELIGRILEMQGIRAKDEDIEALAEAASRDIDINVVFYYYEPTAKGVNVVKKTAQDIMSGVSGITEIIDILASWAMKIP